MFPFITFGTDLRIPTYLVLISFAYCLCLYLLVPRAKKLKMNLNIALDLALIIMVSGFVGARLLHIFYEEPKFYLEHPIEAFKFWNGGFVFLGGLLAVLTCCYVYIQKKKLNFFEWADFYAPFAPLGYAIGRVACFLNGCCYGKACSLPWAVEFPNLLPMGVSRHPTQLYIVLWEVILLLLLLNMHKVKKLSVGSLLFIWLFLSSIGRLFMEHLREDPRGDFILSLSISTWISLCLMAFSVFMLFKLNRTSIKTES